MKIGGINSPAVLKEALDRSLAGIVAGLDPKHYPASLLELLEQALLPVNALRGLPLLTMHAAGEREIPEERAAAQEMLLRGWFLQAELIDLQGGKPQNGLAAELRARFTPAQVLLAADTLFTLPFELLASSPESDPEVPGRFSVLFGPEGALGELDRVEGDSFMNFLGVNPVSWLISAALGESSLREGRVEALSRYVWLREAELWFGGSAIINTELESLSARLNNLMAGDAAVPPGTGWGGLYTYLGIR